jgi:hypothetical protein
MPTINLSDIVAVANDALEPESLGSLVGALADSFLGSGRWQAQNLLFRAGLTDKLLDADFVGGLGGTKRLKSHRLIQWAFGRKYRSSQVEKEKEDYPASVIINRLVGLTSSGALNLFSESSAKMLWTCLSEHSNFFTNLSNEDPVLLSELLSRLCGALDSFRLAGLFLGVSFRAAVLTCNSSAEFIIKLLYLLSQTEEVAMLDGSKEQLVWQLLLELSDGNTVNKELNKLIKLLSTEEVKTQVYEHLKAVEDDNDDEDADEEGNLAGFVTYSDEEDDDDDEEEEEEEEEQEEEEVEVKKYSSRKRRHSKFEKEVSIVNPPKKKGPRLRRAGGPSRDDDDSSGDNESLSPDPVVVSVSQKEAKSRLGKALAALND